MFLIIIKVTIALVDIIKDSPQNKGKKLSLEWISFVLFNITYGKHYDNNEFNKVFILIQKLYLTAYKHTYS